MGLDCIPRRWISASFTHREIPDGQTHPDGAPCPFHPAALASEIFSGCCWLRGKVAAHELDALNEQRLATRMFDDMTPNEALDFGGELRAAALRLEAQHRDDDARPRGAGWNGCWDATRRETVWRSYSTFEEALAEIRLAADWYEKVGAMNYGVHAWF